MAVTAIHYRLKTEQVKKKKVKDWAIAITRDMNKSTCLFVQGMCKQNFGVVYIALTLFKYSPYTK